MLYMKTRISGLLIFFEVLQNDGANSDQGFFQKKYLIRTLEQIDKHCVKSVWICYFFWSVFSVFEHETKQM